GAHGRGSWPSPVARRARRASPRSRAARTARPGGRAAGRGGRNKNATNGRGPRRRARRSRAPRSGPRSRASARGGAARPVGREVVPDHLPSALTQGELHLVAHDGAVLQNDLRPRHGQLGTLEHLVELHVAGKAGELALTGVRLALVVDEVVARATVPQLRPRHRPQGVEVETVPGEFVGDGDLAG